ncbi:MAG: hypothetical protein C0394_03445 [Syntrophus sp. (in: bacteria)]|nr:hypothetical protein [Syntrophus sp. (in: bacteria)]
MGSAISIGTTGMTASSKQMDVIGNNLANANTLGFKAGNTTFASVLNQSLSGGGAMATGQGVTVAAIQNQFTQGSFEATGNATDLAIDGEGFFMVKDINNAAYFTRAGAFHINSQGYLVDGNNYRVQGYSKFSDEESDISLKNVQSAPKASTQITFGANLNDNAISGEKFNLSQNVFDSKGNLHILSMVFQKTEGNGTWGFDVKLDGNKMSNLTDQSACGLYFDKNGVLKGMYKGEIENITETAAGSIAETVVSKPGQLFKDAAGIELTKSASSGVWTVTNAGDSDPSGTPPVVNDCYTNAIAWEETVNGISYLKADLDGTGGADIVFTLDGTWAADDTVTFGVKRTDVDIQDIVLTFGDLGNGATIGISEGSGATIKNRITWDIAGDTAHRISGYASASVIKSVSDDGYASGVLKSLGVGNDGVISGFFTNGQTAQLGQLILANFPDTSGLKRIGNYFGATTESGAAIKNKPGSGGLGEIMSQSLESSNVDVAKEFISMITAQRAYQASSRIITTADQMLTELMNIKR